MKKEEFLEEDFEEDFDTRRGIELAEENDEISSEEAGFMRGFLDEE